jgi:hypothetical protein
VERFTDDIKAEFSERNTPGDIEAGLDLLHKLKIDECDGIGLSPVSKVPARVVILTQVGLRRTIELVEAGIREINRRNLVATALLGQETASQRKFAVLPLGTGNAFAAGLGIQSVREALAALEAQHTTAIDVMRTTHPDAPVALVSISGGFEARFIREYSARRARWTRIGAGLLSLVNAHRRGGTPHILVDGVPLHGDEGRSFNAGLYNMRCYAFGAAIWLDGDHHDGIGEAVVCESSFRYWRMLARGLHTAVRCDVADPRWQRWRHATITAEDVLQVDGELLAPAHFEVRIDPGALRVIVPAGYHGRGPS